MSDMHNHILCAMDSYRSLEDNELKKIISNNILLYRFGSMGGDFFYYYHVLSGSFDPWVVSIGDFFHENTNAVFNNAKMFIHSLSKNQAEKITAYMMGFVNHHALDSETHPFINYFGGYVDKRREETYSYLYTHKRLEILLDYRYAQYRKSPLVNIVDFTDLSKEDFNLINQLYQFLLKNLKKEIIPDHLVELCLSDYKKLIDLSKKYPFLYAIFNFIENITKEKYKFTRPFFVLSDVEKKLDVLNLKHAIWIDPCNNNEKSNHSYPELFQYAVKKSEDRMKRYFALIKGIGNDKNADTIFHNINFDTGNNKNQKDDIRYINCIL